MSLQEEIRALRASGPFGLESAAQRGAAQKNDPELLSAAAAHGKTGTIERVRLGKLPEAFLHLNNTLFMVTHVAAEEPDKYLPSSKGYFVRRTHAPRGPAPPPHAAPAQPVGPPARPAGRARTTPAPAPRGASPTPPRPTGRQRTHVGPAPSRPSPRPAAEPGAPAARRVTGTERPVDSTTDRHIAVPPKQDVTAKKRKMAMFMAVGILLVIIILALASAGGSGTSEHGAPDLPPDQDALAPPGSDADAAADGSGAVAVAAPAVAPTIHFDSSAPITAGTPVSFEIRGVGGSLMMVMWTFGEERIQESSLHNTFAFGVPGTYPVEAVVVLEDGPPVTVTSSVDVVAAEVRIGSDETLTLPSAPGATAAPTITVAPLTGEWISDVSAARLRADSNASAILLAAGALTETGTVDCAAIWGIDATVHPVQAETPTSIDLSGLRPGVTALCVVAATLSGRAIVDASPAVGQAVKVDPEGERLHRRDDGSLGVNPDVGQMARWAQASAADGCADAPPAAGAETQDWPAPAGTFDALEAAAAQSPVCFWGQDALGNWTAPLTFRGRAAAPAVAAGPQTCPGRPSWAPSGRGCVSVDLRVNGVQYTRIEYAGGRLPHREGIVRVCPSRVGLDTGDRFQFWAHMPDTPFTRCGPWDFYMPGDSGGSPGRDQEPAARPSDPARARATCLARCTRDHPNGIARTNCVNRCD